ncbi:hypothetical protein SAMN04488095_2734 [Jannaschia pohangensis]|uniref:Uncharacterized protein n=2 Tax=Jannaschia pohangensis TaxID=390807 RepID=A0A1I3QZE7_9RHOB|nr:hypothetical protein SAMN04488095_2734 [Jannaschia pohangensis]
MAAQEWEPTGETVNLLIVGGLVIVIVTYAAQAFVWLVSKSGMGDLGVMLGWYSQEGYYKANMDFIRVLRFAAIFAIFLGIIAAIVGWAKGTL